MNNVDREAIQDLFARLRAAEAAAPDRDPAAEAYIRERLEQDPSLSYYMAQTIVAQDRALKAAGERMGYAEDGRQPYREERRGGLLGGLFGGQSNAPPRPGPWNQPTSSSPMGGGMFGRSGGGGFLAGAAQTAAGVAGGVVLGNMITDLFDGEEHGDHQGSAGFGDADGNREGLFGGDESAGFGDGDIGDDV